MKCALCLAAGFCLIPSVLWAQSPPKPKLPAAPKEVTVTVADGETFQQLLKELKGHVVFVDYWATWCLPCRKQFPHTVKLSKELSAKGLAVVTISVDQLEKKDAVLAYLKKQDAKTYNLLSKFGTSNKSADAFDYRGDVPFYKLYDRHGKLRYQFSADFKEIEHGEDVKNIDKRIAELLEEK